MDGQSTTREAPGTLIHILLAIGISLCLWLTPARAKQTGPQRIISMSPSITETLFALGVGDRVVGVTDFCSHPPEACTLPKIGGLLNPSVETWITLKPDLIIHQEDSHKLRINAENLGIDTLAVSMTRLKNIFETIRVLGKKLHCEADANALTEKLKAGIERHRSRLQGLRKKSTLLILSEGSSPDGAIYGAGRNTFLGELLDLAGGNNILTDSGINYPNISKEFILRHSPEVIIEAGPEADLSPEANRSKLDKWTHFPTLTAVKNRDIYFIGADYILIPGPRFLNILDHFARVLHPEAYQDGRHDR